MQTLAIVACTAAAASALLPVGMTLWGRYRGWEVGQYSPDLKCQVGQDGKKGESYEDVLDVAGAPERTRKKRLDALMGRADIVE